MHLRRKRTQEVIRHGNLCDVFPLCKGLLVGSFFVKEFIQELFRGTLHDKDATISKNPVTGVVVAHQRSGQRIRTKCDGQHSRMARGMMARGDKKIREAKLDCGSKENQSIDVNLGWLVNRPKENVNNICVAMGWQREGEVLLEDEFSLVCVTILESLLPRVCKKSRDDVFETRTPISQERKESRKTSRNNRLHCETMQRHRSSCDPFSRDRVYGLDDGNLSTHSLELS
eukprot:scaffold7349_cov173-Amphora_coffeaeformis.AAC.83